MKNFNDPAKDALRWLTRVTLPGVLFAFFLPAYLFVDLLYDGNQGDDADQLGCSLETTRIHLLGFTLISIVGTVYLLWVAIKENFGRIGQGTTGKVMPKD